MRVTDDVAIKELKKSMQKEILDRESDLLNLTRVIENLISYLPCSIERNDEWCYMWEMLSEKSQNDVVEAASLADDEISRIKDKYCFD